MNDMERKTNLVGLFFTFFIFLFIIAGYYLEFRRGARGIGTIVFLAAVFIVIYSMAALLYLKNRKTESLRYILVLGFLIPYGYTVLTTRSPVAFAFIFPIFVIAFIFFERRLLSILTAAVFVMNILYIRRMLTLGLYPEGSSDLLLTVSILVVFLIGSAYVGFFNEKLVLKMRGLLDDELKNAEKKEGIIQEIESFSMTLVSSAEELTAAGEQAAGVAEEMNCTVAEIANGASSQAEDTARGVNAVGEMGASVDQTYACLIELNGVVDQVSQLKNEGLDVLQELLKKTKENNNAVQMVAATITDTRESAESIGVAVEMIHTITRQTNLLAFNAAIEAAKAGEQGKSFAVVAEEIRKLAEQARQFTDKIADITANLIRNVSLTVQNMENAGHIIETQTESVDLTNQKFSGIHDAVQRMENVLLNLNQAGERINNKKNEMVNILQNIAATAEENAAGTQEVLASVEEQTAGIEQMAKTSKSLSELAVEMQKSIEKFKLPVT